VIRLPSILENTVSSIAYGRFRKARDSELLDKKSIEEILLELAKLRAVKVGGKWRLTESSKNRERFWRRRRLEFQSRRIWLLNGPEFRISGRKVSL
jgi:hypothetical protein